MCDSQEKMPLLSYGMGLVNSICSEITPNVSDLIEATLTSFLTGTLSYHDCSVLFESYLGTKKPLNKIASIMRILDQPIPKHVLSDKHKHDTRNFRWTDYEDERLLAGLYRFGLHNWSAVATFVGNNRTRTQCSQRWTRALNPQIRKVKWTLEEESLLKTLVDEFPTKSWSFIASRMKNRSDVQCRYHYKQISGKDHQCMSPGNLSANGSMPSVELSSNQKIALPSIRSILNEGIELIASI